MLFIATVAELRDAAQDTSGRQPVRVRVLAGGPAAAAGAAVLGAPATAEARHPVVRAGVGAYHPDRQPRRAADDRLPHPPLPPDPHPAGQSAVSGDGAVGGRSGPGLFL